MQVAAAKLVYVDAINDYIRKDWPRTFAFDRTISSCHRVKSPTNQFSNEEPCGRPQSPFLREPGDSFRESSGDAVIVIMEREISPGCYECLDEHNDWLRPC